MAFTVYYILNFNNQEISCEKNNFDYTCYFAFEFNFRSTHSPSTKKTISCSGNAEFSRNIQVERDANNVTITVGNIKKEFTMANVASYSDSSRLMFARSKYANGELFTALNSTNSSISKDTLTIKFEKNQCAFLPSNTRVVRCMNSLNGGLSILIESPLTTTVSANGAGIQNQLLTFELTIPVRGQFVNIKLKDAFVKSSIPSINVISECK